MKRKFFVKFGCSCIRDSELINKEIALNDLVAINEFPKAGDIVVVQVIDDSCGYSTVENTYGRSVKIYNGDTFIAVLGNRRSGTNNVGRVPKEAIKKDDTIFLLSQGGIVGEVLYVDNFQRKNKALPLKVLGFLKNEKNSVLNISSYQNIASVEESYVPSLHLQKPIFFIFGSSAESGKTTLIEKMIRLLKETYPDKLISSSKAGGTGRLKDTLTHKDAGADYYKDFVDLGYGTTYGLSSEEYTQILCSLYDYGINNADICIFEIGGDLLEDYAVDAMKFALSIQCKIILVVNDAMAAIAGMEILNYNKNKDRIEIATYKQNAYALEQRINMTKVINTARDEDILLLFKNIVNYTK